MQKLIDTIRAEGRYLGNSILKVDSFLNHQVDCELMTEIGEELFKRLTFDGRPVFDGKPVTKIVTAEASGILPAMATAMAGGCRMIYARKSISKTMTDDYYSAKAVSRTRGDDVTFYVNKKFISPDDNVLIVEDFLATGSSISALVDIVYQAQAKINGIGTIIEKPEECGLDVIGQALRKRDCPVVSLAQISFENETFAVSEGRTILVKENQLTN